MKRVVLICSAALAALISGCSSVSIMAPIEDRTGTYDALTKPEEVQTESFAIEVPDEVKPAPTHLTAERAPVDSGRVHVVSSGDTLYNIGVRYGVNPRELQRLNGITDPTTLSIGQELKIPKSAAEEQQEASLGQTAPTVEQAKRPESAEEAAQRQIAEQAAAREAAARGDIHFIWPAKGDVIATFKETKMGIDIAGTAGDPVCAVLDGTVQYVGSNTPGYGKFVIVRHNIRLPGKGNTPLITVYGNNSRVLVRTNESVRAGQQIAEMGQTDSDRVKLRFEVRQGKPIDPIPFLSE